MLPLHQALRLLCRFHHLLEWTMEESNLSSLTTALIYGQRFYRAPNRTSSYCTGWDSNPQIRRLQRRELPIAQPVRLAFLQNQGFCSFSHFRTVLSETPNIRPVLLYPKLSTILRSSSWLGLSTLLVEKL